MGCPRRAWLAILLGVAALAFVALPAVDKLALLQAEFDRETSGVRKAKLMEKLGDSQFVLTREAGKSNDYTAVDVTMEKYRDNVRVASEAIEKETPDGERHPSGYKQLEMHVQKGLRQVEEILLIAPPEFKPPLQLVRQDLLTLDDKLLRSLFPRRHEKKAPAPAVPPTIPPDPEVQL